MAFCLEGCGAWFGSKKKAEATPASKNGSSRRMKLYTKEKCESSMHIIVFLAEAQLLGHSVQVIRESAIPTKVVEDVMAQSPQIRKLTDSGLTWLPCLEDPSSGYHFSDEDIIAHVANTYDIDLSKLHAVPTFKHGVLKDYRFMKQQVARLAKARRADTGLAWMSALDLDGDGHISLDELIEGLDVTRLLAEARRGARVNLESNRWKDALEQAAFVTAKNPDNVKGWKIKMLLGTISDSYDMIITSADKILSISPGDWQALTLKALYCRALQREKEFQSAMQGLIKESPSVASAVQSLVARVDKYWNQTPSGAIPNIHGNMCILALGSPADDDGTPRPRLLGTLIKTLEAARAYPKADIFVTGAAVSSNMPEAIAMRSWLGARGVDAKRVTMEMKAMDTVGNYEYIAPMLRERGVEKIMLITVYYHLNRSSALADAVFEQKGLKVEVIGVAGESDLEGEDLKNRMLVERPASYRDVARACDLFEHEDFENMRR